MITVTLNGKQVKAEAGITVLELARRHGIEIPTLCDDKELNPYGSCWVCAVEVKGRRGFVTSCGTVISPGMEIVTDSDEIHAARKMALELLISDHYADCEAPCKLACPDHVDVQSYVSLIANKQYHDAVKVIKDTLPMPLSIGRVCPAFCERECRRQIVDEAIAIRQLKRYAADEDLNDFWSYIPEKAAASGKRVAIVGAGPSGLTCGYYLSNLGHEVTVFEAAPEAGGWLRYGIPEYRLPKDILDSEIELMCANGMKIEYGVSLGKEFTLEGLRTGYDAVYLAIGAQKAVAMPVKGSDLEGCYLGVDFLKERSLGNTPALGKKVAIVGGGNTAIDCARTAIRLGCEVSVIYRRTKDEMPAEAFEIDAAEQEGVVFHYLCNPVEYHGKNGKLNKVTIEKMRLGEPDSSGRRRPEPTGEFFTESFDSIIAAISQIPDVEVFADPQNRIAGKELPLSRWQTAIVDENTMYTGLENVFAGGDFRRGPATAIEAIADGRFAGEAIHRLLSGKAIFKDHWRFDSKKGYNVQEISPEEFEQYERIDRFEMPEITLEEAFKTFKEEEKGISETDAQDEAKRCLECGCQVNESCLLRDYCTDFKVDALHFPGSINKHPIDHSHPFILRDTNKCINCGRCVRTCAEIQGPAVLGYVYRGYTAVVVPEYDESLTQTTCESCGKCIAVCPVGALVEKNVNYKLNPLLRDSTPQNCGLCGVGCHLVCETQSSLPVLMGTDEENPGFNDRNLCFDGRFGWQILFGEERLKEPMRREGTSWKAIGWDEVLNLDAAAAGAAKKKRFHISPNISLEEMLIFRRAAQNAGATLHSDPRHKVFSSKYLQMTPNPKPFALLDWFDEYVVIGEVSHTLRTMLRLKQRAGKKLSSVSFGASKPLRFADERHSSLDTLKLGSEQLFIYNLNRISERAIATVLNAAHGIDPGLSNVLETSDYVNYNGLQLIGANFGEPAKAGFVVAWGCDAKPSDKDTFKMEIRHFLDPNSRADLVLPAPSFLEIEGSALADDGGVALFKNPAKSLLMGELLRLFYSLGWISPATADINHWNEEVQRLLKTAPQAPAEKYDPRHMDINSLRDSVLSPDSLLWQHLEKFYQTRKSPVTF